MFDRVLKMPLNKSRICEELVHANYGELKRGIVVSVDKRYRRNPIEKVNLGVSGKKVKHSHLKQS